MVDIIWTSEQFLTAIRQKCKPTQKDFAERIGMSPTYISDVLSGRRDISEELANRLGFEKCVLFKRKKK
jgi:transcriptional regulator with XRE-family HTH domain